MNYDIVLPYLSKNDKFGKYQKKIYVLLSIPTVLCAFHKLAGVFLLGVPDYRCRLPGEPSNATFSLSNDLLRSSIPFDSVKNEFSKCTYFDDSANHNESDIRTCNEFIWDSLPNEYSAVQSFNLVCDRSTLRASADSLMMFGVLIGSYVFGDLSDRYGRKPIFMISLLIQAIFGLLTSFAPEFITYSICRMVSRKRQETFLFFWFSSAFLHSHANRKSTWDYLINVRLDLHSFTFLYVCFLDSGGINIRHHSGKLLSVTRDGK